MIELRDLSAGYAKTPVVHGVSMLINPGKVTALMGPNGCGKSTLLKTILSLQPALCGQVLFDGIPSDTLTSRQIAQKVTYVPQFRNTPNISARRMVLHGRFPYVPYPRRYGTEDYEIVEKALKWADAENLADSSMMELSGGERQKVYLAMAFAQDTETILMDEPTTFLDVGHQLRVLETSRQLAEKGKAVLLVLHDVCLALRWVDETIIVSDGCVRFLGTPDEAFMCGILDEVFGVQIRRFETDDGWHYYLR